MDSKNSIKKNYVMNFVLTIASFIFPLLTYPYVSRILLPEGTGKVAFANSIVAYFLMFAQLGIPMYGVRACAQVRDDKQKLSKVVQELVIISIITSSISCVALGICVIIVPEMHSERYLYIILSISILLQSIGMEWLFKAVEKYSYITKRSLILKFISTASVFLLIHNQSDYLVYAGISVFASSASYILNFIYAQKFINFIPLKGIDCRQHIKSVSVFFAMTCASTVYVHLDEVMLGFIQGESSVGIYNTAVKIRAMLLTIVTSLGTVILPRASYYAQQQKMNEFWSLIKKAVSFIFLISIPLTVYFIIFAKPSILLLAGKAYSDSIVPMQWIMPTLFFVGISNITGIQILIPLGKEKIVLYSEVVGAVTDLILNLFLIPQYGVGGAAFATLMAEIFVLIIQLVALKTNLKALFGSFNYKEHFIVLLISVVMSVWIYILKLNEFLTLAISAVLFFGFYYSILYFRKQPLLREIVSNISTNIRQVIK